MNEDDNKEIDEKRRCMIPVVTRAWREHYRRGWDQRRVRSDDHESMHEWCWGVL